MRTSDLVESSIITAEDFNKIPLIDNQAHKLDKFLPDIFDLFRKHSVEALYSPHLLHRHFEIQPREVVVSYEVDPDRCIHLALPRSPSELREYPITAHLLYLNRDDKWQGYEYEAGRSIEWSIEFLTDLKDYVLAHDLRETFALRSSPLTEPFTESEIGEFATITFPKAPGKVPKQSAIWVEWGYTVDAESNGSKDMPAKAGGEVCGATYERCDPAENYCEEIGDRIGEWASRRHLLEWLKSRGFNLE